VRSGWSARAYLDRLVLPADQHRLLPSIVDQVRGQALILHEWGSATRLGIPAGCGYVSARARVLASPTRLGVGLLCERWSQLWVSMSGDGQRVVVLVDLGQLGCRVVQWLADDQLESGWRRPDRPHDVAVRRATGRACRVSPTTATSQFVDLLSCPS